MIFYNIICFIFKIHTAHLTVVKDLVHFQGVAHTCRVSHQVAHIENLGHP